MKNLANRIVKLKWLLIILVIALTVFFGYMLQYVSIDSNVVHSLPANDSIVNVFKEVGKEFGSNQMGMVILESDNVCKPSVLDDIAQITDTLKNMSGISSVTSLTNVMDLKIEDDEFQVNTLINESNFPKDISDADSLRDFITKNKMYRGSLISGDGSATLILFSFQDNVEDQAIAKQIKNKIDKLQLPEKCYYGGASFLTAYVAETVYSDLFLLIPIAFLVMALILLLGFRSLRGIFLPLLSAAIAIVWALGTFVLFGFKLSMVSNNVPIIILAVGTAYTIHILNSINQNKETNLNNAVSSSLKLLTVPIILTALTTIVGFLSFVFGAYLTMIRDFGILAALGTFYSAVLAIFFIPALLLVLPDKRPLKNKQFHKERKTMGLIDRILILTKKMVFQYPNHIIIVWSILIIISIGGIVMIKRSTNVSGYFKKDHPESIAQQILSTKFGGSKVIFVEFSGNVNSPQLLKKMLGTETFMQKSPNISKTQSVADIISKMNLAISGKDSIPNDESIIGQFWFLLDQQENINQLVSPDRDKAIIIAKFKDSGPNAIGNFDKYIRPYLTSQQTKDIKIMITGMPYVNKQLDRSLIHSQILSLSLAIIMVILVVSLIFFNLIKGLIASLPIIFTIIILYGIMGLSGIPLNIVTVLVASIAMGIGVDYSIHFISHYYSSLKTMSQLEAIEETIFVSGKAILINFISVTAGFLVLVFSVLVPMNYFGILIAISMFGSCMGALTLVPTILLKIN